MDEIFKIIFGEFTYIQLFGYLWFFIIGYIIYGLTETTGRDVNSNATPIKWSWKFWFHDNWRRYLTTILCSYILFRFYTQFVGNELNNFECLMMGLVGDNIGATAKKRISVISGDRRKLMENIESKPDNNTDAKPANNDNIG